MHHLHNIYNRGIHFLEILLGMYELNAWEKPFRYIHLNITPTLKSVEIISRFQDKQLTVSGCVCRICHDMSMASASRLAVQATKSSTSFSHGSSLGLRAGKALSNTISGAGAGTNNHLSCIDVLHDSH